MSSRDQTRSGLRIVLMALSTATMIRRRHNWKQDRRLRPTIRLMNRGRYNPAPQLGTSHSAPGNPGEGRERLSRELDEEARLEAAKKRLASPATSATKSTLRSDDL